jgi:hypothetical protein
MIGGAVVDESFVDRYGPPGLVTAALQVFGRLDAAPNAASREVARLYPERAAVSEHASPVVESRLTTTLPGTSKDGHLPGQSMQACAIVS